jgi:REP element-mobilizing transposase RayT
MPNPQDDSIIFHALDRDSEIEITERNLPHWFQVDAAVFITFRLADSLPKEVVIRMLAELREWLRRNSMPSALADVIFEANEIHYDRIMNDISPIQRREFKKLTDRLFHRSLDDCHGACLLKNPALATIVSDAIKHFDGDRYDLDSFVIMPNHVHAIVQFRQEGGLSTIGQSWMRYTAREINKRIGRTGVLWQPEPFDHVIRSPEQFEYLQRYIAANPSKAKLVEGEYLYWKRV